MTTITGTNSGDTIVVTFTSPDDGSYTINGGAAVPFTDTPFLIINSGDGNDTVTITGVAPGVSLNYNGGAGNDDFNGSATAQNTIVGGIGADDLSGGSSQDLFQYTAASHVAAGERIDGLGGLDWLEIFAAGTFNFSNVIINRVEQLGFGTAAGQTSTLIFSGTQLGAGKIATIAGSSGTEKLIVNAVGATNLSPLIFSGWETGSTITINGGAASQSLTGSSKFDIINGLGGNDLMNGGGGNDTMVGGLGKDTQTGGTGNDLFKFTSLTHSSANHALADIIVDFDDLGKGDDKIDLSGLFPGTLIYRGTLAFTAAGQVRINDIAGPDLMVEINTGGSLAPDSSLRLKATTVGMINAFDFIF